MMKNTVSEYSTSKNDSLRKEIYRLTWLVLGLTVLAICSMYLGPTPVVVASEPSMSFVRVNGRDLIDENGNAVYLRGISFGNDVWYKSQYDIPVGHHSEQDYGRVAALGFNSVRFYLNYQLFERDDAPFTYDESGFAWLDQNIAWARKQGIYLILNMHIPQGGFQSNGNGGRFWQESTNQERFIALWKAIARRYQDEPVILAYGILNEPFPTEDIAQWEEVARNTVAAIRQEDQNHILSVERAIVVGNDFLMDNHNGNLNFALIDDPNIMYEFHFYAPHSFTHQGAPWTPLPLHAVISRYPDPNLYENAGYLIINGSGSATKSLASGTHEWGRFEGEPFTITDPAQQIGVPAAVGNNLGTDGSAWFRDIRIDIADSSGARVETKICDMRKHTFWFFSNDGMNGTGEHGLPVEKSQGRALHISGTDAEAFLAGAFSLFPLQQGYTYTISGWMKGQNISEDAEVRIVLATLSSDGQLLPRGKEFINAAIGRFASWAESHNVPLYLGEFGVVEWTITEGLGGIQWISDVLETSVARGIHYNYHSYHESGAFGLFGNDATTPVSMESVNRRLLNLFIEKQNGSLTLLNKQNARDGQHESIRPEATIRELIAHLGDPEWKVRKSAAIALTARGPGAEPAISALIKTLRDEEWQVCSPAGLALAAIAPEDPDVLAALQASLDDPEDQVRRAAARALEIIEALTLLNDERRILP